MSEPAVIFEERLRIPSEAHRLAPFRLWCAGEEFPESGRIDFLGGDIEVDMSPEDAPDLIVEIVSDSSEKKDLVRLPRLYAKAGVPELWTIDARGPKVRFSIDRLAGALYRRQDSDADGWTESPLLNLRCRLSRERTAWGSWRYRFETTQTS